MKQRVTQKQQNKLARSKWKPDYPTAGSMKFEVIGYVQTVNSREEVDYVDFKLDNPYVEGNINSINVAVGWDLPQLEAGDRVCIKGNIRSWWDKEIETVLYTFVATDVTSVTENKPQRPSLKVDEVISDGETPF